MDAKMLSEDRVNMEADCKNHCDLILGHCHEVYQSLAQVSQVWQPEKAFN
jgi:hypothetical protein